MYALTYIDAQEPNVITLDENRYPTRELAEIVLYEAALHLPRVHNRPNDFTFQIRQRRS